MCAALDWVPCNATQLSVHLCFTVKYNLVLTTDATVRKSFRLMTEAFLFYFFFQNNGAEFRAPFSQGFIYQMTNGKHGCQILPNARVRKSFRLMTD
jgi:hypothetical protein